MQWPSSCSRGVHFLFAFLRQALLPLDMRPKKTRAIRKRLTKEQVCRARSAGEMIAMQLQRVARDERLQHPSW
jgi:hypothetical protein